VGTTQIYSGIHFSHESHLPTFSSISPPRSPFFSPLLFPSDSLGKFYSQEMETMILNKIPSLPLPFPLNLSLLFPLIFSPMIFYKKKKNHDLCSVHQLLDVWVLDFTLLFKVPYNFILILPLLNIDLVIYIISLFFVF